MVTITKPTIEDAKGIQEVFYRTWLVTYPNEEIGITVADVEERYKDRFSEAALEKRKNDILNQSDNKLLLLAKENDTIIGVCKLKKEETFNELEAIYVLPEYQGQGIGKMLWERASEFFDNNKDIIVQVATYNNQAINFYKKLGFVDTGKKFAKENHRMPVSGKIIPETEMIIKKN